MNIKKRAPLLKTILDRAGYFLGISVAYIIVWLVTLLGHKKALAVGGRIGDILFFSSRTKAKVLYNLKFAYKEVLSQKELQTIARKVIRNFCKNWTEIIFAAGPSKADALAAITIEGRENLDRALSLGKGVIAVSAHLGNYPLIGAKLTKEGYNFVTAVRDLASRAGSAVYSRGRELIELPSISTTPERLFYKRALKVLKDNGVLCLISDENKRHGGVFVDFFGHPASTAPGPAALALRTGAQVVPVFIIRNEDNTQSIIIEKEIEWYKTADSTKDMKQVTAGFTKAVEDFIRRDPSQWIWTNWRWRTQPGGKSDAAKIRKKRPLKSLLRVLKMHK
jgi:KDO2-lipid IV(A) lauroyltransferase